MMVCFSPEGVACLCAPPNSDRVHALFRLQRSERRDTFDSFVKRAMLRLLVPQATSTVFVCACSVAFPHAVRAARRGLGAAVRCVFGSGQAGSGSFFPSQHLRAAPRCSCWRRAPQASLPVDSVSASPHVCGALQQSCDTRHRQEL
jgi:hypothetical protein